MAILNCRKQACASADQTVLTHSWSLPPFQGGKGLSSYGWAKLGAPLFDFCFDRIADIARPCQFVLVAACQSGRVGEAPVQTPRLSGKDWTPFGAGLVANGDYVIEGSTGIEHVRNRFGLVARDVDADFPHDFDDNWVEFAGFKAGAVALEFVAAD